MNKEDKYLFLILIMLLIAVVSISVGTYAFFATDFNTKVTGTISTWNFKVNNETSTFANVPLDETLDVGKGVAPGSAGSFLLEIDGRGNAKNVTYTINFIKNSIPKSMVFYSDPDRTIPIDMDLGIIGTIKANETEVKDVRIYWKWPYGDENTIDDDTSLAGKELKLTITVEGKQELE